MKHLIIGAGIVGKATGIWLETNKHDVTYFDTDEHQLSRWAESGRKVCFDFKPEDYDVCWICTPETAVELILKYLPRDTFVVVRSSTIPGTLQMLQDKYNIKNLVHNPEFLREKTAWEDMFNPERIVIGGESFAAGCIERIYSSCTCPKFVVSLTESELIKQIANSYLATQISFWNEIKTICDNFGVNSQEVANIVALDKRVSKYGTMMIGKPFQGKCLPKDLNNLLKVMQERGIESIVLDAIKKSNEKRK